MANRAIELVEEAVTERLSFKQVGKGLERLPADPAAVDTLLAAFQQGLAAPWLTAYLLGCIGHEGGYAPTREILLSAPRFLAESYAGVALARIRGMEALQDLIALMLEAPERRSREGAAQGLGFLRSEKAIAPLLQAVREGLIRASAAASVLAKLPIAGSKVIDLLQSAVKQEVQVGTQLVWWRVALRVEGLPRWNGADLVRIAATLAETLRRTDVSMSPKTRRELTAWVRQRRD